MPDDLIPVPDDFELGPTIRGFVPGQILAGRYTLMQILGRGGMGVVWLARDEKLEREVALKFLPELVTLDKEAISDLKRETRRSLELTHPNIVRIYDFVQDSNWAGISMEYINGETLSALKVAQPNRCFEAAPLEPWLRQLAAALTYAHTEAEVVHRDLKPANLMIDARGRLKVADFGIARSISDSVSRVSVRAATGGTLGYMSPQQARGLQASIADDIYSLGATLFDLLAGKPPFYTGEIYQQLLHEPPVSMAERRAQLGIAGDPIPEAWEATVAACLAKEPAQRPQSVAEVLEGLGLDAPSTRSTRRSAGVATMPAVAAPPPPAEPVPVSAPTPPSGPSTKLPVLIIVGLIIFIFLGGFVYWYFTNHQEDLKMEQYAQQQAIEKEKEAEEAQQGAHAQQKAQLEAQTKAAADEAAKLKAQADQQAADEAAAKAKADADAAAVAQAAADKAKADAAQAPAYPQSGQPWTNSLGMKFVPAGTDGVLFCIWDVRVKDFKAFVDATGYDATGGMYSLDSDGWKQRGDSWKSPGFVQMDDCPVVGVSWNDAKAFCDWLTKKDQAEGKLSTNQSYRLPTDAEWSKAVGLNESAEGTPASKNGKITGVYPWGTQWPPPQGAGNYAGSEAKNAKWPSTFNTIDGYNDGYPRTSPVGSFAANSYGLYDMGGNVWQWCEDWYDTDQKYRVARGASWLSNYPHFLLSSDRGSGEPGYRNVSNGFRVVVVVSP